ncbi:hypothetical protein NIES4071_98040 [Calothrix sp. NIES-4071]|nr:hypothetical protein NIES4071_98040 [Calothrix sp. NIES-4071]BAZ64068.1 hypothetical protein NIES4105_97970 [Calothrix sp. NIES-4105]
MDNIDLNTSWFSSTSEEAGTLQLQPEELDSDIAVLQKQQAIKQVIKIEKSESEQQLESLLSNLLKYGVLVASAVVLFGGIIYLVNYGAEPINYRFFYGEPERLRSPIGIVKAVSDGYSDAVIQLGLLVLVSIPVIRVIISLFTFLKLRDITYFLISLLVLTALTYSLLIAP